MVAVTSLLVLLVTLCSLFIQPIDIPSMAPDEPPIVVYDKANLVIGDSAACDTTRAKIRKLITAPQACKTDEDCDTGVHLCGVILNQTNHSQHHQLREQEDKQYFSFVVVQCAFHSLKKTTV